MSRKVKGCIDHFRPSTKAFFTTLTYLNLPFGRELLGFHIRKYITHLVKAI